MKISMNFSAVLLVIFIILKLCAVIDWSWWWVMSPLWIVIGVAIVIATIMVAGNRD